MTTNGPLSRRAYFIRLSKTGDPNAAITYNVGNGGPTLDQRAVIDAGFLELVRLGELPAERSRRPRDRCRSSTRRSSRRRASGPGWHRYNGDGYGDGDADGQPWAPSGQGTGHLWPVLSAERAEQALATGDTAGAASLLLGMRGFASGVGLIPEQDWELAGPRRLAVRHRPDDRVDRLRERQARPARPSPLTWSAASFVRLAADLAAERNVVAAGGAPTRRYVAHTQGTTTLTVTSPADNSSVTGSPVTVTGTTAPGNTVYVAATNTDANSATTIASTAVGRRTARSASTCR